MLVCSSYFICHCFIPLVYHLLLFLCPCLINFIFEWLRLVLLASFLLIFCPVPPISPWPQFPRLFDVACLLFLVTLLIMGTTGSLILIILFYSSILILQGNSSIIRVNFQLQKSIQGNNSIIRVNFQLQKSIQGNSSIIRVNFQTCSIIFPSSNVSSQESSYSPISVRLQRLSDFLHGIAHAQVMLCFSCPMGVTPHTPAFLR